MPLLANGIITYDADATSIFVYNTTATYSCDNGYGLSGGDDVRACVQSPGEWSGIAPTCQGKFLCVGENCMTKFPNLIIDDVCTFTRSCSYIVSTKLDRT